MFIGIYVFWGALFTVTSTDYPLPNCDNLINWSLGFGLYASFVALMKGILNAYNYSLELL